MNAKLLRKIALVLVIMMTLTCFAGCKGSDSDGGLSGVVDTNGVAGSEIEIDIPSGSQGNGNEQQGGETPDNGGETPDNGGETPDNGGETPNNGGETPDNGGETPDNGGETPDNGGETSDNGGETPNYEDLFKEDEVKKPAYDESKELVIVSYNIKCAMYGKTIDQLVDQIKAANADIVGLQEVDFYTSRSKNANQVEIIAGKAGYPYFYFEPVIELGNTKVPAGEGADKNLYGHAIMSKYPIKKSEIIWPKAQTEDGEPRNFGRHEIDVDGTTIAFYNTHLDFSKGRDQYLEVQENYMAKDEYAICVGDFNETYSEFGSYFDSDLFYNFTFGEDGTNVLQRTNVETGKKSQYIDHIIVTKDKFVWKDGGEGNGLFMTPHAGASDHNMIYAHLNIIK